LSTECGVSRLLTIYPLFVRSRRGRPIGRIILDSHWHVKDGAGLASVSAPVSFWPVLAAGKFPELDRGRLMSAFTFTGAWDTWGRHPAGEELVMLLGGAVTLMLEEAEGVRVVALTRPGAYVLVARNTWHTARAEVESSLVFLTPGAGTEHRPISDRTWLLPEPPDARAS